MGKSQLTILRALSSGLLRHLTQWVCFSMTYESVTLVFWLLSFSHLSILVTLSHFQMDTAHCDKGKLPLKDDNATFSFGFVLWSHGEICLAMIFEETVFYCLRRERDFSKIIGKVCSKNRFNLSLVSVCEHETISTQPHLNG